MHDELEHYWTAYLEQLRTDVLQKVGIFSEDDELRELLLESLQEDEHNPVSVLSQWKQDCLTAEG